MNRYAGKRTIGLICLFIGFLLPAFFEGLWLRAIVSVREAITSGNSGHLIYASAIGAFASAALGVILYMAIYLLLSRMKRGWLNDLLALALTMLSLLAIGALYRLPIEVLPLALGLLLTQLFVAPIDDRGEVVFPVLVIGIQLFIATAWIAMMPLLNPYGVGTTDLPTSIKVAGDYLNSHFLLNFVGAGFLVPLFFSALLTARVFYNHQRHLQMLATQHANERELTRLRGTAMESRIHEEINALAHDLKTPLVTIRGLNSLLGLAADPEKIQTYTARIDGAVEKMTDMITSFLYESSRQRVQVKDLLRMIRAQSPMEEGVAFTESVEDNLPPLTINRVRVVRAFVNLVENAYLAPTNEEEKRIAIQADRVENKVRIRVIDNGTGIAAEEVDRIFEMGHSTRGSSGIGLSFAKKIFTEHGGRITVDSTVGMGTTFTVLLPFDQKEEA